MRLLAFGLCFLFTLPGIAADLAECPPESPANALSESPVVIQGKIVLADDPTSELSLEGKTLRLYERTGSKSKDGLTSFLKSMLSVGGHWFTADTTLSANGDFSFTLPEFTGGEYELMLVIDGKEHGSKTFEIQSESEPRKTIHDLGAVRIRP